MLQDMAGYNPVRAVRWRSYARKRRRPLVRAWRLFWARWWTVSKPDYTSDIVAFLRDMVPVEGAYGPKRVIPPHVEGFLRRCFPLPSGDPAERNIMDSRVKKQGKSADAAGVVLFQATRRPYSECVIAAADKDQAKDRVLRAVKFAVDNGPLRKHAKVYTDVIEFSNKSTITALPQDWRGAAGGNYACVVFDELWTYTLENQRRMFDELIIPPTAAAGVRWISTYAGFLGESLLLWDIWQRALAGELVQDDPPAYHNKDAGLLALIDQGERAWRMPWSTGEAGRRFMQQTQAAERPTTWQRIWLNEWVSAQSQFVDMDAWDALLDPGLHPAIPGVPIVFGADASVKHDCTALLGCTYDKERERVELAYCKVWTPRILGKLDPDKTIGDELRRLKEANYNIRAVYADPWQMATVIEKLKADGIRVEEFPQGPRRVESDQALFSAITTGALATYPEQTLRQHVQIGRA